MDKPTRYAVISDVHANYSALQAVDEDVDTPVLRRSAGKTVCLIWRGSWSKNGRGQKRGRFSILHYSLTIKIANSQRTIENSEWHVRLALVVFLDQNSYLLNL
ncbi:MAG: hypothetical protein ACI9EW_002393 [Cellvibrionaceae bacterium]|jgi:hypothetical protein